MRTIKVKLITAVAMIAMWGCAGRPPDKIGLENGMLTPCPKSPNCVSSTAEDQKHHISPLAYSVGKPQAFDALLRVINKQERIRIVKQSDDYLHVEFKSKIFRFVDDVEFFFSHDDALIYIRSASRVGYSDIGVNRKRLELIRSQFTEALKES